MARPQSEALAGRETRRRRLKLVPVSANMFEESSPPIRRRRHTQPRLLDQATVFTLQEILPETLATTESNNGRKELESTNFRPAESKKNLPLGAGRRMVILRLMKLNATQTGPEFYGYSDTRLIEEVYGRKILDPQGNKSPAKIRSHRGAAFQARNAFIAALENPERQQDAVAKRTIALVDEIRNLYPYYRNLTIPQIVGILRRTIDFSEIIRQVTVPTEEVLPDGFVVKKRTYIPTVEIKPLPIPANGNKSEKFHLPPKRKPRIVLESKELPEDTFPKLPKLLNNMTPEEIIVYSLMLIKDNLQGYRYPNAQTAVRRIYDDPISRVNQLGKRSRAAINVPPTEQASAILASFIGKLRQYDGPEKTHGSGSRYHRSEIVHNFVTWADKQALYEGYTPEDLAAILTRHTFFEDVLSGYRERKNIFKPNIRTTTQEKIAVQEEARLSLEGKYLLSHFIRSMVLQRLGNFGITITEQDNRTISRVIKDFDTESQKGEKDDKEKERLVTRTIGPVVNILREFFKNPNDLLKRINDPQTKRILLMLGHLRPSKRDEFIRLLAASR